MADNEKVFVWEAVGILSGDHECFCLAVTAEEYERVKGNPPGEYDENPFHAGLFNLYPSHGGLRDEPAGRVRYRVEIEALD